MKSGGNRFHGSLYEFIRNDLIDARRFELEKSAPPQSVRRAPFPAPCASPNSTTAATKPSSSSHGNRSAPPPAPTSAASSPNPKCSAATSPRPPTPSANPSTSKTPSTAPSFPGNQIPVSRLDPVALKLASYYPQPNLPFSANNYVAQANSEQSFNNFSIKGDHSLSPRDRLTLSTFWRPNTSYWPFNRSPIALFGPTTATFDSLAASATCAPFRPPCSWNSASPSPPHKNQRLARQHP